MNDKSKEKMQQNQRTYLKDILPLEMPLSINIEVTNACNLACKYCIHSLKRETQISMGLMPYEFMSEDIINAFIEGLRSFGKPIKSVRFAGFGEPLLHRQLSNIIKTIKRDKLADKVVIFTNAFSLTCDKILELVESGVDSFQLDIQGLSDNDYKINCDRNVDFNNIVNNVKFLYENKGGSEVYIRTLRFEVEGRREEFYNTFKNYADYIAIDNTCSISDEIDYSQMINEEDLRTDENNVYSRYCPQPFFQLTVNADGTVAACCGAISRNNNPLIIGNIKNNTLKEMWNGTKLRAIRQG